VFQHVSSFSGVLAGQEKTFRIMPILSSSENLQTVMVRQIMKLNHQESA
jgi:hypothetical protein